MAWTDYDLASFSTLTQTLPEGKFTFSLMGAKKNPYRAGTVDCTAKVAEGDLTGSITYFSYPEPDDEKYNWVKGVLARMFIALRQPPLPEEVGQDGLIAYFNRLKGTKFIAPIKHRIVQHDGADDIKAEINIGNVTPAKLEAAF